MPRLRIFFGLVCLTSLVLTATVVSVPLSDGPSERAEAEVIATAPSCGTILPKADGGSWACTFNEEFAGTELDRDRWVSQQTALSGWYTAGGVCYFDSPSNIRVRGGVLHLIARRHEPFECKTPSGAFTASYTGGSVSTWGRFSQTYGRFEIRAAFPKTTVAGLHSTLWLYPQKHTYGAWPNSGEIDIAERFTANPGRVFPTAHYPSDADWTLRTGWGCYISDPEAFHRYAIEWTPQEMRFIYDGKTCWQHSWTPKYPLVAPQPFDHPFQVVLTQALGGGHNAVSSATPLPAETLVDWVRVWR